MYRNPLAVNPKTSSTKNPRPSNSRQPVVKHGKVASLVKSLDSLDKQPTAGWRRSPASRDVPHGLSTARTAPLIPLPPRIPERKPYDAEFREERDSASLERRRKSLAKGRDTMLHEHGREKILSSLPSSTCEEWHSQPRLDNSPRRFSSEQRQGLFYGGRSP